MDKFRKGKSNFATTLVTGIGTGTSETITLNSTAGLPTDTEIVLTFNRVTSSGVVNPTSLVERIRGKISGSTLTSYTRGVDSTTEQAHGAGTVVEYIPNAEDMNDLIDGILVEHNQDGTHDTTKVVDLSTAQTLTNKTIGTSNLISFNAPEGFLINGKIVPSVASNNLTVALKTLSGDDPSATNPIYVRIGDTVHSITGALSITANAGANYLNMGSAMMATNEIDLFVYLAYGSISEEIELGFSRLPCARVAGHFSKTSTDECYCTNIAYDLGGAGGNCNSTDAVVNIGRFAATLSAGPGYTWSVPTFTSSNLIQRPIYETRWLDYSEDITPEGSMTYSSTTYYYRTYKIQGDVCHLLYRVGGTTGGSVDNNFYFSPPFTPADTYMGSATVQDGGGFLSGRIFWDSDIYVGRYDNANFGTGAGRSVIVNMSYEISYP